MTSQKIETIENTYDYNLDGSHFYINGDINNPIETKKHIGASSYKPHLFFRLDEKKYSHENLLKLLNYIKESFKKTKVTIETLNISNDYYVDILTANHDNIKIEYETIKFEFLFTGNKKHIINFKKYYKSSDNFENINNFEIIKQDIYNLFFDTTINEIDNKIDESFILNRKIEFNNKILAREEQNRIIKAKREYDNNNLHILDYHFFINENRKGYEIILPKNLSDIHYNLIETTTKEFLEITKNKLIDKINNECNSKLDSIKNRHNKGYINSKDYYELKNEIENKNIDDLEYETNNFNENNFINRDRIVSNFYFSVTQDIMFSFKKLINIPTQETKIVMPVIKKEIVQETKKTIVDNFKSDTIYYNLNGNIFNPTTKQITVLKDVDKTYKANKYVPYTLKSTFLIKDKIKAPEKMKIEGENSFKDIYENFLKQFQNNMESLSKNDNRIDKIEIKQTFNSFLQCEVKQFIITFIDKNNKYKTFKSEIKKEIYDNLKKEIYVILNYFIEVGKINEYIYTDKIDYTKIKIESSFAVTYFHNLNHVKKDGLEIEINLGSKIDKNEIYFYELIKNNYQSFESKKMYKITEDNSKTDTVWVFKIETDKLYSDNYNNNRLNLINEIKNKCENFSFNNLLELEYKKLEQKNIVPIKSKNDLLIEKIEADKKYIKKINNQFVESDILEYSSKKILTKSELMKLSHKLAKTFEGDYKACLSLAMKQIYQEQKILKLELQKLDTKKAA